MAVAVAKLLSEHVSLLLISVIFGVDELQAALSADARARQEAIPRLEGPSLVTTQS